MKKVRSNNLEIAAVILFLRNDLSLFVIASNAMQSLVKTPQVCIYTSIAWLISLSLIIRVTLFEHVGGFLLDPKQHFGAHQ